MTVPTYRSREDYTGNGVTTSYPYQFRIYKATDLVVTRATPEGAETTLVLNTDYTVTGVGKYAGGNVVLSSVLASGYRLAIERALPVTQETDLRNQGAYFAETHEDVFDRAIMLLQRIAGYLGLGPDGAIRTLLLGKTDIDGQGAYRAHQNRIQDLGDPVNSQDAANKQWTLTQIAASMFDGVGNALLQLLASSDPDKGAALIGIGAGRTQADKNAEYLSVEDFGAVGDGLINDSAAFISAAADGRVIQLTKPQYLVNQSIFGRFVARSPVKITGGGSVSIQYETDYYPQGPLGLCGMRIVAGETRDAHYGWGGIVAFPSGKWVMIYRKAATHGITDNAELRARDSYDNGATWTNDRLIYQNALHDARPDAPRLMANNRMGFFVNCQDVGTTHFSPLFFKSDNEGTTFSYAEVTTSSPYTFAAANGGILDFPASQGGHDSLGFVTYGYLSAGGLDAFTTTNNGDSWSIVTEVAVPSGIISAISENIGVRIGTQDQWLFFCRSTRVDAGPELTVFATTNLLNWGTPRGAGVDQAANPPGAIYDPRTNKVSLFTCARGGRAVNGFEDAILTVSADADALFAANGNFASLGQQLSLLTPVPAWGTGYFTPIRFRDRWYATFTCGESGLAGGDRGLLALIGDFPASSVDTMKMVKAFTRHLTDVHRLDVVADDNSVGTSPLRVYNASKTASSNFGASKLTVVSGGNTYTIDIDGDILFDVVDAIFGLTGRVPGVANASVHLGVQGATYPAAASYASSTSSRKHYVFHNTNGEVGSISTSGTATAFTTTSDERLKNFIGPLPPEKAIEIIKADPVREFDWKEEHGGGRAVGWGAQTSHAVSQDLAVPGGWFTPDGEECAENVPGAIYVPWGIDQSKRTPYLWAAVSGLVQRLEAAEQKIQALENK